MRLSKMIIRTAVLTFITCFVFSCGEKQVEKKETSQQSTNTSPTPQSSQTAQQTQGNTKFPRSGVPVQGEASNAPVNAGSEPEQNQVVENRSAVTPTSNNSTLRVAGKAIVIYFPTNEDMLNTPETDANAGFVEVLSEFEQEARLFQQYTGIPGAQVFWSTERYISVQLDNGQTKVFERNMVDRLVGVIFTDGKKEPMDVQSLISADEYRKRAKKFFGQ